ncbi:hypothetical protein F1721_06935 [Saccharopolyspora hirsuta]|uniref:Uncharacterized protein n=1 Tax=Saccharopolyspora hirsuta TaxID=1837 RepID=A0A5M7C6L2_SACHI|nr:hypothetical protein [Saccharopolyspora hirsuta]KAA5836067.1 hypothetical protein F1721_06935 [Saccharopolyspora hirsuta]
MLRYAEVLCADCTASILSEGWGKRFEHLVNADFSRCGGCLARIHAAVEQYGTPKLVLEQPLKWMPEKDRREYFAVHEAAHAVVGTDAGFVLDEVLLGHQDTSVHGTSLSSGGMTRWDMEGKRVATDDYHAYIVAGMRANLRWLAERGWDTHANRIDVAYGGFGDVINLENDRGRRVSMREAMDSANRTADARIAQRWPHITAVAQQLLTRSRLNGTEVRRIVTATQASRPTAPSTPTTTTHTGGSAMAGIEEIQAALANTKTKTEQIYAALAQVQQWAGEIAGHLYTTLGQSQQSEVLQAIAAFRDLSEEGQRVSELHQLVYAAVSEIEQYGNRL